MRERKRKRERDTYMYICVERGDKYRERHEEINREREKKETGYRETYIYI